MTTPSSRKTQQTPGTLALLPMLSDPGRVAIEQVVSDRIGRPWAVHEFRDLNELSSHPAAILSDGAYAVFVKFSAAANGLEQFETELANLRLLSDLSGVLTPIAIANLSVEDGVLMVLEAVPPVERTSREWRQIGQTLAQIHQIKGAQFGLETNCYFGPLYQDNRPMEDWAAFYVERRLWPRFMGAINSGQMPTGVIRKVEKLISRVPGLCGSDVAPTLLHGDAQQNNFISSARGAFVIDPAAYYGNAELDLAYIDYFQPVPGEVLDAYREILPIDPGFHERRDLWRIYGYLAAVEVEGAAYLPGLIRAVNRYL